MFALLCFLSTSYTAEDRVAPTENAKIENYAREISLIAEAIHQDMEAFKDVVSDAGSVVVAIQKNKQQLAEILQRFY